MSAIGAQLRRGTESRRLLLEMPVGKHARRLRLEMIGDPDLCRESLDTLIRGLDDPPTDAAVFERIAGSHDESPPLLYWATRFQARSDSVQEVMHALLARHEWEQTHGLTSQVFWDGALLFERIYSATSFGGGTLLAEAASQIGSWHEWKASLRSLLADRDFDGSAWKLILP